MKKAFLTVLSLFVLVFATYAQDIMTQGAVEMEISEVSSQDEQAAMGVQMLKGSKISFVFNEEKYKTIMNMMGGMMKMTNLVDLKTDKVDLLMDAMGSKMWVDTNMKEVTEGKKVDGAKLDIKYDKTDVKEIKGFKAYKFTFVGGEGDNKSTVAGYITDQIKTAGTMVQGLETLQLPGTPLEVTITNKVMSMTITTVSIEKEVPQDAFKLDTEGSQKMTMQEFKNMGGAGMGLDIK